MHCERSPYGQVDGRDVEIYTLENDGGLRARITNYGAILVGLEAPDRDGRAVDLTLGHDDLAGWVDNPSYMGATVGRYGNRIAAGRFPLDGRDYALATNNGANHLHGGEVGFNKRIWEAARIENDGAVGVLLRRESPDGEEGYPGTLTATVRYLLDDADALRIDFTATTDRPTIVNLVHHSYWNLSGDHRRDILDHELELAADAYLPVDAGQIPTGERADVAGTPMDFRRATPVGARIDRVPGGYDHNWILREPEGEMALAARVRHPGSGRVLEVHTDQAGIQFYAGNNLDGSVVGKGGVPCAYRTGLCLETQRWPDSPNHPEFPSPVLRPGETYRHAMEHRFLVD